MENLLCLRNAFGGWLEKMNVVPKSPLVRMKLAFGRLYSKMFSDGKAAGVAISFDDAHVDEWYCLKDLFGRYGARVTFFVSNFDLLPGESIEKLKMLRDDGHEIAFHGLRHLSAGKFVQEHSLDEYLETEIFPGIDAMNKAGFSPMAFSYPYGVRAPHIDAALLKYFRHVRGVACTDNKRRLTDIGQIYCGHEGRRFFAAGIDNVYGNSVEEIRAAMKKALEKGKTLLLFAHRTSSEPGDYCTPVARIESVLEYASGIGLKFYTIKDI